MRITSIEQVKDLQEQGFTLYMEVYKSVNDDTGIPLFEEDML